METIKNIKSQVQYLLIVSILLSNQYYHYQLLSNLAGFLLLYEELR